MVPKRKMDLIFVRTIALLPSNIVYLNVSMFELLGFVDPRQFVLHRGLHRGSMWMILDDQSISNDVEHEQEHHWGEEMWLFAEIDHCCCLN